jgi:hypothetical protein
MGKRKERDVNNNSSTKADKREKKKKKHKKSSSSIKKEGPKQPVEQKGQPDAIQSSTGQQKEATPQFSENHKCNAVSISSRPRSHSTGSISLSYADLVTSTDANAAGTLQQKQRHDSPSTAHTTSSNPTTAIYFQKRVQLTVSLLPFSLHNVIGAIRTSLRKRLLHYNHGWGGILLAFDNVEFRRENTNNISNSITSSTKAMGWILNELPYIHYHIDCDILVFAPSVGCQVSGFLLVDDDRMRKRGSRMIVANESRALLLR